MKNKKIFGIGAAVLMILLAVAPAVSSTFSTQRCLKPNDPTTGFEEIESIFEPYNNLIISLDQELENAYLADGLYSYEFDPQDFAILETIFIELTDYFESLDEPDDWEGYNGWGDEEMDDPDGMIYYIWMDHMRTTVFAHFLEVYNVGAALIIGALLGVVNFSDIIFKLIYALTFFIRNDITTYSVLQTDEGNGVKFTIANYYFGTPFIPEFGWIEPQVYGDIPPHQGSVFIPSPI